MGNRLEENCCIKCGNPLIELEPNAWHTCTPCTERVKKLIYDAVSNSGNKDEKALKRFKIGSLAKA